ncbi:hypothetical protein [Pseudomonas aeruginosa]|nr:hypothetical protein [Pseudomonas aeruginosa]MCS8264170.1 hypothetical protein [Pseudomonas aeruginosa]MCT1132992.1 hypothetical protein [Pseudomonas aeruginosa]
MSIGSVACGSSQQLSKKACARGCAVRWPSHVDGHARVLDFKTDAGGLSMRSSAEHLRMQRDERRLKIHAFLVVPPNPFVDEVGIEAVAQGDVAMDSEHSWMTWALNALLEVRR